MPVTEVGDRARAAAVAGLAAAPTPAEPRGAASPDEEALPRPTFRTGLVEPAETEPDGVAPAGPSTNGSAPRPRPRRTRPLRAT